MKVKELIKQLQQCDPDAIVCEEDIDLEMNPYARYYEIESILQVDNRAYYNTELDFQQGDIVVLK